MDRQCPSCGGFCKKSGCERENIVPPQRVYCSCGDGIVANDGALCGICVSLKKMREWQGLTGEELQEIYQGGGTVHFKFALIETKLKEKNT
jgi:hypothetical protein